MAALPMPSNVSVNIFRNSNPNAPMPPGNPALANVPGYLKPWVQAGRHGTATWLKWTHILYLPTGTDVRDAYNSQLDPNRSNNLADTIGFPNANGVMSTFYYVVFVELAFRGTPFEQLRVYLDRFQPTAWPANQDL